MVIFVFIISRFSAAPVDVSLIRPSPRLFSGARINLSLVVYSKICRRGSNLTLINFCVFYTKLTPNLTNLLENGKPEG
jgi:hypothetical protein